MHLLQTDDERMGPVLLARFTHEDRRPPGFRFMNNDGDRCAALDGSVPGLFPCMVYHARPDDCRLVEPGSPACLEARRLGHLGSSVEFKRPGQGFERGLRG